MLGLWARATHTVVLFHTKFFFIALTDIVHVGGGTHPTVPTHMEVRGQQAEGGALLTLDESGGVKLRSTGLGQVLLTC